MYLGIDRPTYPGDDVLTALHRTGRVSFVGVHLGPEPQVESPPSPSPPAAQVAQVSTSWLPHVAGLVAAGWGIAPVYGDRRSTVFTASRGTADAGEAIALAERATLPEGAVVYLHLDVVGRLSRGQLEYVGAWAGAMRAGPYRPGARCAAGDIAIQLTDDVGRLPVWVVQPGDHRGGPVDLAREVAVDLAREKAPDPSGSGDEQALVWRHRTDCVGLTWTDETGATRTLDGVNLDTSVVPDPSKPLLPIPVITDLAPSSGVAGDTVHLSGLDLLGITGVAFGAVPGALLGVGDESALDVVVPDGLAGHTTHITVTNRWSLSGTSSDTFDVQVTPEPATGNPRNSA